MYILLQYQAGVWLTKEISRFGRLLGQNTVITLTSTSSANTVIKLIEQNNCNG